MEKLISNLVSVNVSLLHIRNDGPSSQFKNKFIANAIIILLEKYSKDMQWHFFATSHGNSKNFQKKTIKVNDCFKVLCEHYKGYYTIVISQSYGGEWKIQHFKKSFDKYVLKVGDFDPRERDKHNAVDVVDPILIKEDDILFQNKNIVRDPLQVPLSILSGFKRINILFFPGKS